MSQRCQFRKCPPSLDDQVCAAKQCCRVDRNDDGHVSRAHCRRHDTQRFGPSNVRVLCALKSSIRSAKQRPQRIEIRLAANPNYGNYILDK
jgi:hypothetical protein